MRLYCQQKATWHNTLAVYPVCTLEGLDLVKELTAAAIEKFRPGPERRRIRDALAKSLFLVIEPSGHKSFQMRFRRPDGKPAKLTLGPVDFSGSELKSAPQIGQPLTLAAARLLAAQVHQDRARGLDPIGDHKARKHRRAAEREQHEAGTFAVAVQDYVKQYARPRNRNWRETARLLGLIFSIDGNGDPQPSKGGLLQRWAYRDVRSIDAHDVFAVVEEARSLGVPGTVARHQNPSEARARLLYVALSSLFSWLKKKRRVDANPCTGVDRPDPAKARDRVLTKDEIRWLWTATDAVGETFGTIFKLLLLTGARLNEVAGMTWDELSDDYATWSLPGSRTKNGRPHVVPLAPLARDLIAALAVDEREQRKALLFTTTGTTPVSGWSRVKKLLDKAMVAAARAERGRTAKPWRLHDLRRTAVTGMAELGIRPDIIEIAVNHISGHRSGIAGIYNKSDLLSERKLALERWSLHVIGLVSGEADNVIALRPGGGT